MKLKRIIVGFLAILLAVGGLGIANVFQETEVTEAADGENVATVTFRTTAEYPFDDGTTERVVQVDLEAIETMELPLFKNNDNLSFVGWTLDSKFVAATTLHPNELVEKETYSPATLLRQGFYAGDEAVFTVVTATQGAEGSTDMYEYGQTSVTPERVPSISSASPASGNIVIYSYDGSSYTQLGLNYSLTTAQFQQALFDLYTNGDADLDYVIFIGGNIPGYLHSNIGNRSTTAPTGSGDVTFYSLQNRIKSLTITGNAADVVNDTAATAEPGVSIAGRLRFSGSTTLNLGTDFEFRNIWYQNVTNIAANGNRLYLGGGSFGYTAATVYGGSSDGTEITPKTNASVTVSSTGFNSWNLYGGNNTNAFKGNTQLTINSPSFALTNVVGGSNTGSVTGNSNLTINNTRSGYNVTTVVGGSASGSVSGNVNLLINQTSSRVTNLYGGTNSGTVAGNVNVKLYGAHEIPTFYAGGNTGTINGDVSNFIRVANSSTSFRLGDFVGGTYKGTVNGDIDTFVAGYGGYSTSHFAGVGYESNVGSATNSRKVSTILDTSLYSTGTFYYSGVNRYRGVVYADILNVVRSGRAGKGALYGLNGTSAIESRGSSSAGQTILGAGDVGILTNLNSTDIDNDIYATTYDGYTPEERRTRAEGFRNRVYGNVTSHALGGTMSSDVAQIAFMRAGGFTGYIEGNTSLTTGIIYGAGKDKKAGGYNFVRHATVDRLYDAASTNAMKDFQYLVSESGAGRSSLRTLDYGEFDIVGGTGDAAGGDLYGSYLYGDSSLIHNNVLARWTYGSNFSGVHEGDSNITLNGGLVDTLEGSGYYMVRHYGNSTATMNNGEINFFFSGSGWQDWAMFGDVSAVCNGGVVNCAIGGTYGGTNSATSHYVFGNATTVVKDGRFNGSPSHGSLGFSGGATQSGHIYGDISLTLDLREAKNFALPSNTNITGGRSFSSGSSWTDKTINTIGKADGSSTATLNIYTKPGSNLLNGANIYGDGGPDNDNDGGNGSRAGRIIMNIDAPDSTIGNLYATQYRNIPIANVTNPASSANTLRKSVDINVLRAGQIGSLSGGNANDTMNNSVAYNSSAAALGTAREVNVKLGTQLDANPLTGYDIDVSTIEDAQKDIFFGTSTNTTGLVNFTNLSVENAFTALAGYGNIKNGVSADDRNHYNQYDKFGDVTIEDGSGLGVTSASSFISIGDLTVNGEGHIYSPAGNGKINLAGIAMPDQKDRLTWHMQSGGANTVASTGSYFGAANAYQVLTFTATEANGTTPKTGMASDITPLNFMGIDDSSGKTFVGDNDLTTSASATAANHREFGIMIPGSVIDYNVSEDVDPDDLATILSGGTGLISHDVTLAKSFDEVTPTGDLRAIATWAAGVEKTSGRLVIPILGSDPIYPTLTFNPENPTGSWLRKGTIDSTKVSDPSYDEILPEQDDLDADMYLDETDPDNPVKRWKSVDWTMGANTATDANEYSYTIDIIFSNELELTGRNVIVTEPQAKALADEAAVRNLQEIFGRPFLTTSLSQADLDSLQAGLDEGTNSKTIPITYQIRNAETEAKDQKSETWNIVIVPDGAVIAAELDVALYAKDGQMTLAEAGAVIDRVPIDAVTNVFTIKAIDGVENPTGLEADLDKKYIDAFKNISGPKNVPVAYTATYGDGEFGDRTLTKDVTVRVMGYLYLSEVTDIFDFGTQKVTGSEQTYWPTRKPFDATEDPDGKRGWTDIVVSDTRGDNLLWNLSVKELAPLKDELNQRSLPEMIYYQDSAVATPKPITDAGVSILSASNGKYGEPEYIENYDVTSDWVAGEKGVQLTLPSSAQRTGSYSGELEWTLSFTP